MTGSVETVLRLPESARSQLCAWVEDGYPEETCGLMLGTQSPGEVWVEQVVKARNVNLERARDRYEVAPEDFLAADNLAGRTGREVVGIWHSHPDHPARPSETDRCNAWSGWSYVILSVHQGKVGALRSWRLDSEDFFEEAVEEWRSRA